MLNSVGMMKPATNDGFHKEPLCSVATLVGWSSPTWVAIQNGSAKFGKGLHTKVLGCSSIWGHLSRRNGGLSDKQGACVQSLWSYWPQKQPNCISKQKLWDRSITQETGISLFKRFYDAFKHMNDRMTCCGTQVEPPGTISWSCDIAMEAMALSMSFRLKHGDFLQDGAPKIAKLVYKWLNNGLW